MTLLYTIRNLLLTWLVTEIEKSKIRRFFNGSYFTFFIFPTACIDIAFWIFTAFKLFTAELLLNSFHLRSSVALYFFFILYTKYCKRKRDVYSTKPTVCYPSVTLHLPVKSPGKRHKITFYIMDSLATFSSNHCQEH